MQNGFVISISLFYLSVSLGLTVNVHYCMGEVDSITLSTNSEPCCCGHQVVPPACCDDEQVDLTLDVDQQLSPKLSLPDPPQQWIAAGPDPAVGILPTSSLIVFPAPARAPPGDRPADLRLLYKSLTFYG